MQKFKKPFLAFLILILLVFLIFLFYNLKSKKVFFPRGKEIENIKEEVINSKIDKLLRELNFSPENTKIMVELGIYYFLKGPQFYDKSINLLHKAWQLGNTDTRIFYYLGSMYEFLNLNNLAINEYKKFLNNHPEDLEVNLKIANLYFKTGKVEDALNNYFYILKKDKTNIIALTNIGFIYFSRNELDNANEYFLKVKEICKKNKLPEPKNINFYLGKIFFLNKDFDKAKLFFEQERLLYPQNIENNLMLAKTYFELKDFQNSAEFVKQLLKDIPKNKELLELKNKLKKFL
jgi:tetratricopeptide (TPR) repeat protein